MIRRVEAQANETDRDLERRVSAFLAGRNVPALRRLYVRSSQGVVTLRGHVATFYEKQLGGSVARRVAGVVQLIDDINVAGSDVAAVGSDTAVAAGEKILSGRPAVRPAASSSPAGQILAGLLGGQLGLGPSLTSGAGGPVS